VKDLEGAVLRAGVEDVPGLVEVDLDDGVGVAEVEDGGHEVVELGLGEVQALGLRAEPVGLTLARGAIKKVEINI